MTVLVAANATGLYSAHTFPADNINDVEPCEPSDDSDVSKWKYDLKKDPLGDDSIADTKMWNAETQRFTFFAQHMKKGMSNHSTKPIDDPARGKARRRDLRGHWKDEPVFLDVTAAKLCCGSKDKCRPDCRKSTCLVKCPHPDCEGGLDPDKVVSKCSMCPLALPDPARLPGVCQCGVSYLISDLIVTIGSCHSTV